MQLLSESLEGAVLDRRGFLTLGTGVAVSVANDWLAAIPVPVDSARGGNRIGESVISALEVRLPTLRRLEESVGGGIARPVAQQELRLVFDLVSNSTYSSAIGKRLFGVAAELGRVCGWTSFDSGLEAAAEHYWLAAMYSAHLADDQAIGANILKSMSLQALDAGRTQDALSLAEAAHRGVVDAHPNIKAMMTLRRGRALAHVGDGRAAQQMLDAAQEHMMEVANDVPPDWSLYFDDAEYSAQTARCWMVLDRYEEALVWLEKSLNAIPESRLRDFNTYQLWRAESNLRLGNLEQGCQIVEDSLPAFRATHSSRNRSRLIDVGKQLRQFGSPISDSVDEQIREAITL